MLIENKNICITGGTGFLGSAMVRKLSTQNHITILDDNSRGKRDNLYAVAGDFQVLVGDVRDEEAVLHASKGCDILIHAAAINGTSNFYDRPDLVLDVGICGALATLSAARKNNIEKYVLISSSEIYQTPTIVPTAENERAIIPDVHNPRYSYAGSKIISELLTLHGARLPGQEFLIIRPHNIYGPSMGFKHVIPQIIHKIFLALNKGESSITIQGDGSETRAFCYVEDAVDQIELILAKGRNNEVYNIGVDHERKILDLCFDIAKLLNCEMSFGAGAKPSGATSRRCPDISKLKELGYQAADSYEVGMEQTVNWYWQRFEQDLGSSHDLE